MPRKRKARPYRQAVGPIVGHVASRIRFTCSRYPEKHPGEPDIIEHSYIVSKEGNALSEQDVLQKHMNAFPYDEVIKWVETHTWSYYRDSTGRRVGKRKRLKLLRAQ